MQSKFSFDDATNALPELFFQRPPDCGLILGSGWGNSLPYDTILARLSYAAIPGLGASTISGHQGELLLFEYADLRIMAFLGRRHWYEGAGWGPVVLPVELLRRLETPTLLITNAAGGIRPTLRPGDFVAISDHLNTLGLNPLIGPPISGWGPRFPDQSEVYSARLRELLHQAAREAHLPLTNGIYAFTAGPGYETPAEIRAYAGMGADLVGMSTLPEAVVANAAGLQCAALSCVSNLAAGLGAQQLTHTEVIKQTQAVQPTMQALLGGFLSKLAES